MRRIRMFLCPVKIIRRFGQEELGYLIDGGMNEPLFAHGFGTGDEAGTAAGFWGEDGAVPGEVGVEVGLDFAVYLVDCLWGGEVCDDYCSVIYYGLFEGWNVCGVDALEGWGCC